jgi:NTE family protein
MWSPHGPEPDSIDTVLARQKDLQYASRVKNVALRQRQLHRLRHIVAELVKRLPAEAQQDAMVREMAAYGCLTRMHVVRLLAKPLPQDDHSKDIDFSEEGIRTRWQAGLEDAERALAARPWTAPVDPLDGLILHEFPHDAALAPATP